MVLVFGNGTSGKAAAELLRREGHDVRILDGDDEFPAGTEAEAVSLCVASPGVPLTHSWQKAARERGIKVVSELQLGAERWRAMGGRMIAVTGSKGKSSVVKVVAEALGGIPCGNYGRPLCDVVLDHPTPLPWAVVEVSSFQMETTSLPEKTFAAAAILNLQEDHLDRHGSVEAYHALKRRLLSMAEVGVEGERRGRSAEEDTRDAELFAGTYFDNPVLREGALCAVELMRAAGLDRSAAARAFAAFRPLPHRFETVCEEGGVKWVDDSKATSLKALCAGVSRISGRRTLLIAGGLEKGDDPNSAISCLQSGVKKVYLIGRCAEKFSAAWRSTVVCETCGTLDAAVEAARRDAVSGDVVLLSPGAASFDQFNSYGERGDRFADLAKKGKTK